jgi:hypothetical protein
MAQSPLEAPQLDCGAILEEAELMAFTLAVAANRDPAG